MKILNNHLTIALTALAIILGSCSDNSDKSTAKDSVQTETSNSSNFETAVIPVEGMTCSSCVSKVKKTVKGIDGVKEVEVSLERREARVKFNSEKVSADSIAKSIDEAGYEAGTPIIEK